MFALAGKTDFCDSSPTQGDSLGTGGYIILKQCGKSNTCNIIAIIAMMNGIEATQHVMRFYAVNRNQIHHTNVVRDIFHNIGFVLLRFKD